MTTSSDSAHKGYPVGLLPYFGLMYAVNAVYQNFFSNYLVGQGIEKAAIGTIMAVSPLMAMLAQPVWGAAGDRMKLKNALLILLTAAPCAVMLLAGNVGSVWWAAAVVGAYAFFQTAITPLMDAVALESLARGGYGFGPVRMTGTIAYAVTAPLVGLAMAGSYKLTPWLTALFLGLGIVASLFLPKVRGHQHGHKKVSMWSLLKDRQFLFLLTFTAVLMTAMSFYNTYFSVYFMELGASPALLGWASFISAAGEVPFLLVGDKLFRKLGVSKLLLLATVVVAVRFALVGLTTNLTLILLTQLMHGWGYIVMAFAMAKYISMRVPGELSASGQMLYNVMGLGIARAIGSFLSGRIVLYTGMRNLFFIASILALCALIVFGYLIYKNKSLQAAGLERQAQE